jgi:hypothetical protein
VYFRQSDIRKGRLQEADPFFVEEGISAGRGVRDPGLLQTWTRFWGAKRVGGRGANDKRGDYRKTSTTAGQDWPGRTAAFPVQPVKDQIEGTKRTAVLLLTATHV